MRLYEVRTVDGSEDVIADGFRTYGGALLFFETVDRQEHYFYAYSAQQWLEVKEGRL